MHIVIALFRELKRVLLKPDSHFILELKVSRRVSSIGSETYPSIGSLRGEVTEDASIINII